MTYAPFSAAATIELGPPFQKPGSPLQRAHLVFLSDAADIFPDALFNLVLDLLDTAFCAENDVVVQRCVSVCHNRLLPPNL